MQGGVAMAVDWGELYSKRLGSMTTSVIREILKVAQSPEVISLSGGWPEADLFPIEQLQEVATHVMRQTPREALQYGLTDGSIGLRRLLAEQMQAQGVPAGPENILITSGSSSATCWDASCSTGATPSSSSAFWGRCSRSGPMGLALCRCRSMATAPASTVARTDCPPSAQADLSAAHLSHPAGVLEPGAAPTRCRDRRRAGRAHRRG